MGDDKQVKVWDTKPSDVVRFVLRRDEWDALIKSVASGCAMSRDDAPWRGLEVLENARVDVDASAMVAALEKIVELTKHRENHIQQIVNSYATNVLPKKAQKETAVANETF